MNEIEYASKRKRANMLRLGHCSPSSLVLRRRNPHHDTIKTIPFVLTLFYFSLTELFKKLETETGVPKVLFFIPACLLIGVVTTIVGGFKLVVDLLGFLYPAYCSFKSMDSGNKDDTQVCVVSSY